MMAQSMCDAVDVVLDVAPVVIEVRIPAACRRREHDLETPVESPPAQARADRMRDEALDHQRPLEILYEEVAEVLRLAFQRATSLQESQESLDAVPGKGDCRTERCRAQEHQRKVERAALLRRIAGWIGCRFCSVGSRFLLRLRDRRRRGYVRTLGSEARRRDTDLPS